MPRVSREAKAASHARILEVAARQFRERGIGSTGVADVMKAAGLTHGGFYRHFETKDDLAAAAIARAFDESIGVLEAGLAKGGGRPALVDYVNRYLSEQHVANPGVGCPIVTLGTEAARGSPAERMAIAAGIDRIVGRLAEGIGGEGVQARQRASGLLSLLVGTVVLARSASTADQMRDILTAGRQLAERCLGS